MNGNFVGPSRTVVPGEVISLLRIIRPNISVCFISCWYFGTEYPFGYRHESDYPSDELKQPFKSSLNQREFASPRAYLRVLTEYSGSTSIDACLLFLLLVPVTYLPFGYVHL